MPAVLPDKIASVDPVAAVAAPASPPRSLKSRALQWLAQREYSRAELRRKLVAHARRVERDEQQRRAAMPAGVATREAGADRGDAAAQSEPDPVTRAAAIESLLDWLEAHRYLCDERFVESRVHARIGRFGNARIRMELAQHGVALSPDAERRLRETEFDRARALWLRKYGCATADPSSRARQSRFLAGRGFGAEVIARALREAARAPDGTDVQTDVD